MQVDFRGGRVEYMVKLKAQFKRKSTANNVEIYVPVPDDADTPKFRVRMFRFAVIGILSKCFMHVTIAQ